MTFRVAANQYNIQFKDEVTTKIVNAIMIFVGMIVTVIVIDMRDEIMATKKDLIEQRKRKRHREKDQN